MARAKHWTSDLKDNAIEIMLDRISKGESLRQVLDCERDKELLPSRKLFNEWLSENKSLSDQYARACEQRADVIFEDILNIADDNGKDIRVNADGIELTNQDVIQRSRLRVDARKWMLSKMMPKKYGDKMDFTTDGESINLTPEERSRRITELLAKVNAK